MLVPALLSVTVHEVSHGYVADRLGDPTSRLLGRISLNPLRHVDLVGLMSVFFLYFGWGRPAPVNYGNMNNPRQGMVYVAAAGPAASLCLALFSSLILQVLSFFPEGAVSQDVQSILNPIRLMAAFSLYCNTVIFLMNLLPFPPFDGGKLIMGLVSKKYDAPLVRIDSIGFIAFILVIYYTSIWSSLLMPIVNRVAGVIAYNQTGVVEAAIRYSLTFSHNI